MEEYIAEFGGNVRFLNSYNCHLYDTKGKIVKCKCGKEATQTVCGKESFLARCNECWEKSNTNLTIKKVNKKMEWISVKERKPTPQDSPIMALDSLEHFSIKALIYLEGWDGFGWYDASEEYGMGLNKDEAHFDDYGGMKFWMPLPPPPSL